MPLDTTNDDVACQIMLATLPERCCGRCSHWTRKNPDDVTAPEGKCSIPEWSGHWPTGYWPNTLQRDKCASFDAQ
jgi:hypothetical protein